MIYVFIPFLRLRVHGGHRCLHVQCSCVCISFHISSCVPYVIYNIHPNTVRSVLLPAPTLSAREEQFFQSRITNTVSRRMWTQHDIAKTRCGVS